MSPVEIIPERPPHPALSPGGGEGKTILQQLLPTSRRAGESLSPRPSRRRGIPVVAAPCIHYAAHVFPPRLTRGTRPRYMASSLFLEVPRSSPENGA